VHSPLLLIGVTFIFSLSLSRSRGPEISVGDLFGSCMHGANRDMLWTTRLHVCCADTVAAIRLAPCMLMAYCPAGRWSKALARESRGRESGSRPRQSNGPVVVVGLALAGRSQLFCSCWIRRGSGSGAGRRGTGGHELIPPLIQE
jgi:hypothetical protein